MKNMKRFFCLLTLALLSFALLAGCGSAGDDYPDDYPVTGDDWRTTGIIRDSGIVTRSGEDTRVLVCVHKADAAFYYDSEDQALFGFVEYPITFGVNVWDLFKGIDFADLNGDSDSDVTMKFDDDGSEIVMVWYWNTESEEFVYQPERSSAGDRKTTDEIYHELLERFYVLVSDPDSNMDTTEDGEFGVLESARGMGKDAVDGMGYLIEDLSGDGVPELAVGSLREYGGEVYALYTLVDNEPELVFEGWYRNSYTYVDVCVGDSSSFYNLGSSSAVESCQGVFTLARNGRELDWKRFYFTYAENGDLDNVSVYANTTGSWEPEESELADMTLEEYYERLSLPVAESMTEFWGLSCTESGLDLIPFSDYTASADQLTTGTERDDGNAVPILMGGVLPFTNMEPLQSENHEDGTYYYADITEDGMLRVVNTVMPTNFVYNDRTLEDYLTACAMDLAEPGVGYLLAVEQNDMYSENMSYPVYVVTYTAGENEDTRVRTVFAMDTERYTYLYGFDAMADAAEDMKSIYQDIFAGLYLSDGE